MPMLNKIIGNETATSLMKLKSILARLASNNTRKTVLVTVPNETSNATRSVRQLGQKTVERDLRRFEKIKGIKLEDLSYAIKF